MGNVIKLAQQGYDVRTCGDENLIYSSEWPLFKIYKQDSATVKDVTQTTTVATHDLGFPPVFWYFSNATINKWLGTGTMTNERRAEFFGPIGSAASIKINDSKLVYESGGFATGNLNLYYYIFGLDLTKQYTAPIIRVGAQPGEQGNRVFKIAKEGKSVSSDDLRDFVIHSRARSPMVHSVNPSGTIVKTFIVTHDLGYNPMFFGYTKGTDGYYTLIPTGTGGSSNFTSTDKTVTFNDTGGKEITIVILKDPFIIDQSVVVSV